MRFWNGLLTVYQERSIEMLATYENLMRQATGTVLSYLDDAITGIDQRVEPGFAVANPQLVGELVREMNRDFRTSVLAKCWVSLEDKLERFVSLFEAANPQ
jgi:hypothetical protein